MLSSSDPGLGRPLKDGSLRRFRASKVDESGSGYIEDSSESSGHNKPQSAHVPKENFYVNKPAPDALWVI